MKVRRVEAGQRNWVLLGFTCLLVAPDLKEVDAVLFTSLQKAFHVFIVDQDLEFKFKKPLESHSSTDNELNHLAKVNKVDDVFQVNRIGIHANPEAITIVEVVGEKAQKELVDLENLVTATNLQIGELATCSQFLGTLGQELAVVGPSHARLDDV